MVDEQVTKARGDRERARLAERSRRAYAAAGEIGALLPVANPKRRKQCERDLLLFLQAYFPGSTGLAPFGKGQIRAIDRIERSILHTGRFINGLPRGFAKTTLSLNSLLWAVLYGHRTFALLLAAKADHATNLLTAIMTELQQNELLLADFPEVCGPIQKLEGKAQRCAGQTYMGERTLIKFTSDQIIFPRIPGSPSSESIIKTAVVTSVRGAMYRRSDGSQARPDIVIMDDPQSDMVADSPSQVTKLKSRLSTSIARLGGHGKSLAQCINSNVIQEGDLIDQLCSAKHPEWQSVRIKMVERMPDRLDDLWLQDYAQLRQNYDAEDIDGQMKAWAEATEFYEKNREAMDAGAEVGWPHMPIKPEEFEVSPLQHAMNILIDDGETAFLAECQNTPKRPVAAGVREIRASEVKQRFNNYQRFVVPDGVADLVFHCDVHNAILYYSVLAIKANYTGFLVDYGTFPEQPHQHFTMFTVRNTLKTVLGTPTVEEAVKDGVTRVAELICGRDWVTPNGESIPVGLGLYDVGYFPEHVAAGIRGSEYRNILMGSRGRFIDVGRMAMTDYDTSRKRMIRCGPNPKRPRWYIPPDSIGGVHAVSFDSNYWKSVVAARLTQDRETPGEWSIYGTNRDDHSALAEHLAAEEAIERSERGYTGIIWKNRPNRENHWFDSLVGCAVAASMKGIQLPGQPLLTPRKARPQEPRQPQSSPRILSSKTPDGRSFWVTSR